MLCVELKLVRGLYYKTFFSYNYHLGKKLVCFVIGNTFCFSLLLMDKVKATT
jgi:hypothetical protein